ncbi:ABC transporter permease [Halosegnis sp.]|uniref:ABC transporter permease n=1 Tax=Halosegnis sp. TaxID=2864959 RepID=UPI0035D4715F
MATAERPRRDLLLALAPTLLAVGLGVVPLVVLLVESIGAPPLANYRTVLSLEEPLYLRSLGRSLGVGLAVTAVCLVIAYPVTYWLAHRCPKRHRLAALVALTLPLWLNYVVLNYTWVWILAPGGLVNETLAWLGLRERPLELLYTDVSMFIGFVYIYLPYVVLTMYVSMERLDSRLIEAARDLGATNRRVFLDVVLPQTLAGAAAGALIVYARIAGAFATPEILGGPGNVMVARLIVNAFYQYLDYGFAAALSFVFLAIVAAGFLVGASVRPVREALKRW